MKELAPLPRIVRFGSFEVDLRSEELYKSGIKLRLQEQPFRILAMLLERPGGVVTREELRRALWPSNTFVDFDHGVNTGIKKIREALGDSAENPRFVETLPRHGYRFIAPVIPQNHADLCCGFLPARDGSAEMESLPPGAESATAVGKGPALSTRRRRADWALAALGLAAALIAAVAVIPKWLRSPGLTFHQRDRVLIAGFENRTGEPLFDGMLEYALERELNNSTFVNVVPHDRIADTLRLMKKPPNTRLDASLGREVCLRDGGIRGLLTGRLEHQGVSYFLNASVMDPLTGSTLASFHQESAGRDEVPAAVHRLSDEVRRHLGEAITAAGKSGQTLEKATTPSLRALQLYSQAMALVNENEWHGAAALLDQTLKVDPEFTSAHIYLAHAYSNLEMEQQAAPHYEKAFALADKTTDRERFFILGSYYGRYRPDSAREIANYEALVRLYPDFFWGVNNLVGAYRRAGRWKESIPYVLRCAELRPQSYRLNHHAAFTLFYEGDDPTRVREWELRARKLIEPETVGLYPRETSWDVVFPATDAWQRNDVESARKELSGALEFAESLHDKAREEYLANVGLAYPTLGNRRVAKKCLSGLVDPNERHFYLALTACFLCDSASLREYSVRLAREAPLTDTSVSPILMTRAGLLSEVQRGIEARATSQEWKNDPEFQPYLKAMQGELALARGKPIVGISLLETALQGIPRSRTFTYFLSSEALARAWDREGHLDEAIGALERASAEQSRVDIIHGFAWMRIECELAQLYRRANRPLDAQRVERHLQRLLVYADSDFPTLTRLRQSSTGADSREQP
jgi:DNA-binding winged helix-turn-helix (wHTH) protein/tetratricopeptide (TPR) repeat protein